MFVPPTWFEGLIVQVLIVLVIPLIIGGVIGTIAAVKARDGGVGIGVFAILFCILLVFTSIGNSVYWHNAYEKPSVQEKIITVSEWQPKAGIGTDGDGRITITNADQLMLITTEQEGFFNNENFFFQKFNTRDILNTLRVNGTYKIKYYGWREGFNSGFPNILSVEEVINENNTVPVKYSDYFGTKYSL